MKIRGFFALCIFRIRSRIEVVHESAAIRGKETLEAAFLTESGKSPASIARSNKQWVGTCLYQEWYKPLLISCEAAARL